MPLLTQFARTSKHTQKDDEWKIAKQIMNERTKLDKHIIKQNPLHTHIPTHAYLQIYLPIAEGEMYLFGQFSATNMYLSENKRWLRISWKEIITNVKKRTSNNPRRRTTQNKSKYISLLGRFWVRAKETKNVNGANKSTMCIPFIIKKKLKCGICTHPRRI